VAKKVRVLIAKPGLDGHDRGAKVIALDILLSEPEVSGELRAATQLSERLRTLGLADSLAGLIAAYPSFTVPFVTWLLMGYFESIPVELEESAMIDGATRFGAFRRIILPLAAPGVLAAALYAFTQAWNEFLYALVFITDVKQRTLPVGLSSFITGDVYGWGYLMAGAVLTTVPVIVVYIYLQKYMVEGLTAGSVKG